MKLFLWIRYKQIQSHVSIFFNKKRPVLRNDVTYNACLVEVYSYTWVEKPFHGFQARTFAKLRKATISFFMSVRPSARMEELGSHRMDFHEVSYLNIFRNSVEKIQI